MRRLAHALHAAAALLAAAGCNGTAGPGAPPPVDYESLTRTTPPEALAKPVAPPAAVVYTQRSYRMMAGRGGTLTRSREREEVRATAQCLRVEYQDGRALIVRADRELILALHPGLRQYEDHTFAQARARLEDARRDIISALPDMKGRERRMAEVLVGRVQPKVSVAWAEKPVTIAGRECWHVRLSEDGDARLELWVTPAFGTPPVLETVTRLWGELSETLLAEYAKIEGFPMRLRLYGRLPDRARLLDMTVEKIEVREALDSALFEVPEGYARAPR